MSRMVSLPIIETGKKVKTSMEDRLSTPVRWVMLQIQDKPLTDKNVGFRQEVWTVVIILSYTYTKVFKSTFWDGWEIECCGEGSHDKALGQWEVSKGAEAIKRDPEEMKCEEAAQCFPFHLQGKKEIFIFPVFLYWYEIIC